MYLLMAFLSKTGKVHDIIKLMKEKGFTGGTLFDSVGMKRAMPRAFDIPLVASLHTIFDEEGNLNKVLFCIVESMDEVEQLTSLIESVVGDLHEPNNGLVIAQKIDFVKGYDRWKNVD